jgi:hypothetical protein
MGGKSGGKNKDNSEKNSGQNAPDNSAQIAQMKKDQAAQAQSFARMQADAAAAAEKKRKAEEQAAKERAIASESSRARGLSLDNQTQIGEQLSQTLATPMQQNATAVQAGYTPSGFAAGKPMKSVPGNTGGAVPSEAASTMPSGLIAQKINQDSGGTNQQQNRFNIPKTEGLVFGGT